MKFNWGHGLTLGMILFILYIMFMVVQAVNTDFTLETENYYAKELKFQDVIDKRSNYNELGEELSMTIASDQMKISFPSHAIDSGLVYIYRPSDASEDLRVPVELNSSNEQTINLSQKIKGRYQLIVEWYSNGVGYYHKKDFTL